MIDFFILTTKNETPLGLDKILSRSTYVFHQNITPSKISTYICILSPDKILSRSSYAPSSVYCNQDSASKGYQIWSYDLSYIGTV